MRPPGILGYEKDNSIDLSGIDVAISVRRANIRAREFRKLMRGDLNNDMLIIRAEIQVLMRTEGAGARSRFYLAHRAADNDRDTQVTLSELRGFAQRRAVQDLTEAQAEVMRDFMIFDLDQNGQVHLDEVMTAVQLMPYEA